MSTDFQVIATNASAPFTLKLHRGDGMLLLAMNWKSSTPPADFVGFAIEYREPGADRFWAVSNRLAFPAPDGSISTARASSRLAPIQKFRWVHFPRNADLPGPFTYRVTPVFMNERRELSYGEPQQADIALHRATFPGQLNIAYTRGFVSSQAFVDRFVTTTDGIETLLPKKADDGLDFTPSHPKSNEALVWMGFEAREEILTLLDQAIADPTAIVRIAAYDINDPAIVSRLESLGPRLWAIIDDSASHGKPDSAESHTAARLAVSAGPDHVLRQHCGGLQHNKFIVVAGEVVQAALCGSTNFTWRGQFVQNNNVVSVSGPAAIKPFITAFDQYWDDTISTAANWRSLGLKGINARITFSPHAADNAALASIGADIAKARSSVFYSLAFLNQTSGPVTEAIRTVTAAPGIFVYGIADKPVGGFNLSLPDGKVAPVSPAALSDDLPEPFKSEPTGGFGTRMHHKFVVIDFDKPTARVYTGSYNFSNAADRKNGENLLLLKDRRIAVSYMVQALTIFDHYHFRILQAKAATKQHKLALKLPPSISGAAPWWLASYEDPLRIHDRQLFA